MKSAMSKLLVLVTAMVLPACAVQPGSGQNAPSIDYAKMAAVEQQAAMQGVEVRWIHPPERVESR
ncbi:hypothetical protein E4T66_09935 [Sinimarinibacterium sp. CAU 1509]|uniref:hypothetical protein n=1 Tax=Sinimarinibacterium sp. CAU 1509 TaxID=2562283 RepID=UPI0010ABCE3B|nr:hypothetical protein [Sinimarinibacterium sp. CAU 1509]TJY60959.1 hypothetical protein E4T66_09935 [Sinimarinibacterium sp. CAU 1509]